MERFFQILEIFWTDGAAADGAPTDGPTEADGSTAAGGAPPSSPAGAPTDGSTPAADESTVAPTVAADRQEGEDDGSNPLEPTDAEVLDPYMIPSQVAGEPKESSVEVSSSLEDLGSERAGDLVEPTPPPSQSLMFEHTVEDEIGGKHVERVPYISPKDFFQHLVQKTPDLVLGGSPDFEIGRSFLKSFWEKYRLFHPSHRIYHYYPNPDDWAWIVPMCLHGDEGRGLKKGNTCVITLEPNIGLNTYAHAAGRKRPGNGCGCTLEEPCAKRFRLQPGDHYNRELCNCDFFGIEPQTAQLSDQVSLVLFATQGLQT